MRSIYIDNAIHSQLKLLAAHREKTLTDLVEDFLRQKLAHELAEMPSEVLQRLSAAGGSLDFLNDPAEDIYSPRKPVKGS